MNSIISPEGRRLARWASRLGAIGTLRETDASWLLAKALAQAEGVHVQYLPDDLSRVDCQAVLDGWHQKMTMGRGLPARDVDSTDPAWMHAAQDWSEGPEVFILDRGGATSASAAKALIDALREQMRGEG